MDKNKQLKQLPSSAALLGRAEEEDNTDDYSIHENVRPFEMGALKARAFKYEEIQNFILLFIQGFCVNFALFVAESLRKSV